MLEGPDPFAVLRCVYFFKLKDIKDFKKECGEHIFGFDNQDSNMNDGYSGMKQAC